MLRNIFSRMHAADGGASGGDEDDPDERVRSEDIINRSSNAQETIARLGRELDRNEDRRFKQRDLKRQLRQEIEDLRSKTPADGARLLTADEAKAYDGYVALGKPPADLKAALDASGDATTKLAALERDAQIRDAATAHGYTPAALGKLPSLVGKTMLLKDETVDGKPIKRAYVADGGKETALADYIQAHDPEFLPSLTSTSNGNGAHEASGGATRGTAFVQQHAGGGDTKPSVAQSYIQRTYNKEKKT